MSNPNLKIDLQYGMVPVSRAASALASLIKRSNATEKPIIITQKGYPTGVLLSIELYTELRNLINEDDIVLSEPEAEAEDAGPKRRTRKAAAEQAAAEPSEAEAPTKGRRGRRKATEG
jgi:prevent-host-death family protein